MDRLRTQPQEARASAPLSKDAVDVLFDLSQLVRTGLSREQLQSCLALADQGVSGEAVAAIVKELRRDPSLNS
ncbi:unnamed protein product [Tilletia controversa]|uniref:Mitotic-spindle organizing protein 1 n=4 Tax=Tilletia TaxID=13289 RepID=A0A8X7MWA5_9BASI|nr:hypothetical protein CF336_g2157 [Tilletia laevis]KAE8251823.1 hypothetical protein A4X06_0g2525 [Tilletia controversa]CAD6925144.1 unnamed protein product [Tilletia caries]CAD6910324.1 unnamed protein product [Tilletia laevis]CAD6936835.1 unnamed protein product [Tilletia controversa]